MHNFLLRRTMVHFLIIYWMLTWAQAHLTVAHTSSPAARLILPTSAASIPSRLHMLPDEVVHSERRGLSADATLLNRWRSAVDGGTSVKQITTLAEPNLSDEPLAAFTWTVPSIRQLACEDGAETCAYRVAYSNPFTSSGVVWQLMLLFEDPSGGHLGPSSRVTVKLFASLAPEHWQPGEGVAVSGEMELQNAPQDAPWRSHGFHTRLDRSSASVGHDGWIGDHVLAALRRGRLTLALRLRRVAATWHSNSTHTEALVEREMWSRAEAAALASVLGVRERFSRVAVSSAFANDGRVYTTYKYNGVQTTLRTQVLSMLVAENLVCHLEHLHSGRASRVASLLPDMFKAVLSSPPSHSEPGAPAPEGVKDRRLDSEAPLLSSSGEDLRPYLRPCAPSSQQPSTQEAAGPNQHAGAESRGKGGWTAAWPAAHTPGLNARPAAPGSGCQWLPGGSAATANSWAWAVVVTVAVVVLAGFEVVGKRPWRFRAWHQTAAPISPSLSLLDDSPASSRCSSFSAAPGGSSGGRSRAARRRNAAQAQPAAALHLPAPAPGPEGWASRDSRPAEQSPFSPPPAVHAERETIPFTVPFWGSASLVPDVRETRSVDDAMSHAPIGVSASTASASSSRKREQRRRRRQASGASTGIGTAAGAGSYCAPAIVALREVDVDRVDSDQDGLVRPRGLTGGEGRSAGSGSLPGGTLRGLGGKGGDALDVDDVGTCIVCMDAPRAFGFLHGHAVHVGVCGGCAKALGAREGEARCPVCRDTVERVVAIYD